MRSALALGLLCCVAVLRLSTRDFSVQAGELSDSGRRLSEAHSAQADVVVVGSGPGATGFLYRLLQLQPNLTVLWLERGPLHANVVEWPEDIQFDGPDRFVDHYELSSRPYMRAFAWRGFGGGDALNSGGPNILGLGPARYEPVDVLALRHQSVVAPSPDGELWKASLVDQGNGWRGATPVQYSEGAKLVGRPSTIYAADGLSRGYRAEQIAQMPNVRVERVDVRRVLFDGDRAVGVEDRTGHTWHAGRAVVLAAGVFGTFDVLVESGIGPEQALTARRVKALVVNEAVGKGVGAETPVVVEYVSAYRSEPAAVNPSLAAHDGKSSASLCWWADGIFTWWSQRHRWLAWLSPKGTIPALLSRIAFVAVSVPNGPPVITLEATADSLVLNDDAVEFTQEMCEGLAAIVPDLKAGFSAEAKVGQALTGWDRVEYTLVRALIWLITPLQHNLQSNLLTLPNVLTMFDLTLRCTKNELADYFHYHGGSGSGVIDAQYAVRHVTGLYVSDASVLTHLKPGGPTATVMQEGMRVADAVSSQLYNSSVLV